VRGRFAGLPAFFVNRERGVYTMFSNPSAPTGGVGGLRKSVGHRCCDAVLQNKCMQDWALHHRAAAGCLLILACDRRCARCLLSTCVQLGGSKGAAGVQ